MPDELSPEEFSIVLPLAVKWVRDTQQFIARIGQPLTPEQQNDARRAGVKNPEQIRVAVVPNIPQPDEGMLKHFNEIVGLVTPETVGLCLYYSIFIRNDCPNPREVLVHECVHTAQYERLEGIERFLKEYLVECNQFGYPQAPMEQEAISLAHRICS